MIFFTTKQIFFFRKTKFTDFDSHHTVIYSRKDQLPTSVQFLNGHQIFLDNFESKYTFYDANSISFCSSILKEIQDFSAQVQSNEMVSFARCFWNGKQKSIGYQNVYDRDDSLPIIRKISTSQCVTTS